MPTITEGPYSGEHLISEANGTRSREVVTLSGGNHLPGTVLGMVTATGVYKQLAPTAEDGTEKAAAVLFAAVDASTADKPAVITARDSEVQGAALLWPAGATASHKTTALAELTALGIVAR